MINYNGGDIFLQEATQKDLLITDGTVNVSGTSYTVTGATVTITNELLDSEAFELKQSLCSESQIHFGSCEAAQISFTMHENIPTIKGKTLKVYLIPNSDASKILQIGVFKVDEDKLSADRTRRTITAYDAMYDILNADVAGWYNAELPTSTSTKTLAQFRADFLTYFNITAESTTLANDSITIKRTIEPESLSGGDVIKAICEINGVFGVITNEGKFRFKELFPDLDSGLFPSDTLYPADDLYPQDVNHDVEIIPKSAYIDVQFEDYMSESITGLTVRTSDDDAGVTVGTSTNRYVITGNFLVYGYNATNLTSVATAIFNKIKNRYYKPCTVNAIGNPLHEVGDGLRISTTYRGIVTYILERSLKGIQALRDTYSAQGAQLFNEQLNSVSSQFKQLSGKVAQLKVDTDGIEAKVEYELDNTKQGSYAYMTEQEIGLKVTRTEIVDDLNTQIGSGITIGTNYIHVNSSGEFTVDATNFELDQNGDCTLGSVTFTGGEIEMTNGAGLSLYHGGIAVELDGNDEAWLNIDASNSGVGTSTFDHVAINGDKVHINFNGSTTDIYHCENIYNGTDGNYAFIRMDDSYGALRIQGRNESRILIDSSGYTEGIALIGTVDIGGDVTSRKVKIKGTYCKWKNITIDGTTYNLLAEDDT